jgi:hypothetical protein
MDASGRRWTVLRRSDVPHAWQCVSLVGFGTKRPDLLTLTTKAGYSTVRHDNASQPESSALIDSRARPFSSVVAEPQLTGCLQVLQPDGQSLGTPAAQVA